MSVEPLAADYLSTVPANNSGFFGASGVEAPAMFRRGNRYYALFGHTCCFCKDGAPVVQYVASSPLGPFTQMGTVDSVSAQQTAVFEYATSDSSSGFSKMSFCLCLFSILLHQCGWAIAGSRRPTASRATIPPIFSHLSLTHTVRPLCRLHLSPQSAQACALCEARPIIN